MRKLRRLIKNMFSCAVCRKDVGCNFILCQFYKCWVRKKCSGIGGRLKQDEEFKCWTGASQKRKRTTEECPGIESYGSYLAVVEKIYYHSDKVRA